MNRFTTLSAPAVFDTDVMLPTWNAFENASRSIDDFGKFLSVVSLKRDLFFLEHTVETRTPVKLNIIMINLHPY